MNPDRYYSAALRHVNRVRALRDLDPIEVLPEGRPRSFAACPIARAVGGVVAGTETCVSPNGESVVVEHPPEVVEFVRRFDCGFYPELDGRLPSDPHRRSEDADPISRVVEEDRDLLNRLAQC
jgi:hypothetical protein